MSFERVSFRRIANISEGQVDPTENEFRDLPLIAPNHVESGTGRLLLIESASEQNAISGKYLCEKGDILYSKIRPHLAKVTVAPTRCLTSADMYPITAGPALDAAFLKHYLLSDEFTSDAVLESERVAMPKINRDRLGAVQMPLPDVTRQRRIAAFLDAETERIDQLIATKVRMIELLGERTVVTARRAVSRGIKSAVELRRTGSDLLPELPRNWRLTRARFVCDVGTGHGDTVNAVDEGAYPFFIRSKDVMRSDEYLDDCEAVLTSGDGAGVGKDFHYWERGPFNAHQRVYVLNNFRLVSGRFFYYVFSSLFPLIALDGRAKATFDSVRRPMITEMPCPLPPEEEQAEIVEYLDRQSTAMHQAASTLARQIGLLQERRRSLITAAVTGEMEVP